MKKITVRVFCLLAVAAFAFLLTAPMAESQTQDLPKSVGIATHPKGSLLNMVGSTIAKVFSATLNIGATDRPYTGYIAWLPLVHRGELDLGICTSFDPYYAYRGMPPFREKLSNLRIISSGAKLNTGWVVLEKSGIRTMTDLKGKRVCIDKASLSTRENQEGTLRGAGLDLKKDIKTIQTAGVAEPVRAVIEGRADATWASVGMSTVKELIAKAGAIYWVPVVKSADDRGAQQTLAAGPGADFEFVKAGTKPDVSNDTWVWASPIYLMSHTGLSDEAAYQFAKTLWEKQDDLIAVHPLFKGWTQKGSVSKRAVTPYHPGAIRFYKEKGVWSDEMDQVQKKLLSE